MRWLWPDEAAAWLGVPKLGTLHVIAHREGWRRARRGRRVQYALEDVARTREKRQRGALANDSDVSNRML